MARPLETPLDSRDLAADPANPGSGVTRFYTKGGKPHAIDPSGNVTGPVQFGDATDIGVETFGASASAGATNKVADAGHVHEMPSSGGGGSPVADAAGKVYAYQNWR